MQHLASSQINKIFAVVQLSISGMFLNVLCLLVMLAVRSGDSFPAVDSDSFLGDDHEEEHLEDEDGYDFYHGYEGGLSGRRADEDRKAYYDKNGGRDSGHEDTSSYYKNKDGIVKSAKGGGFVVANTHEAGNKTSGFHNVHHKEEYEKKSKFYDEHHKNGSFKVYGDFGAALLKAEGTKQKGEKHDGGFEKYAYGLSGRARIASLYDKLKEYGKGGGFDANYHKLVNAAKAANRENILKY